MCLLQHFVEVLAFGSDFYTLDWQHAVEKKPAQEDRSYRKVAHRGTAWRRGLTNRTNPDIGISAKKRVGCVSVGRSACVPRNAPIAGSFSFYGREGKRTKLHFSFLST